MDAWSCCAARTIAEEAERRNAEVIILGATRSNGSRRRNSVDPLTQEVAARARQRVMFIHEKEAA